MHPNDLLWVNRINSRGSPVQVQDRHLKAALLSIPRCHMPAWNSSLFGGRAAALWAHGWAASAQDWEHMKNCQCFPEPLKHNREAANSYVGTRKLSKTFKLLFLLGDDPDLTITLMVKKHSLLNTCGIGLYADDAGSLNRAKCWGICC